MYISAFIFRVLVINDRTSVSAKTYFSRSATWYVNATSNLQVIKIPREPKTNGRPCLTSQDPNDQATLLSRLRQAVEVSRIKETVRVVLILLIYSNLFLSEFFNIFFLI